MTGVGLGFSMRKGFTHLFVTLGFSDEFSKEQAANEKSKMYANILFKQNPKLTLFLIKILGCLLLI